MVLILRKQHFKSVLSRDGSWNPWNQEQMNISKAYQSTHSGPPGQQGSHATSFSFRVEARQKIVLNPNGALLNSFQFES